MGCGSSTVAPINSSENTKNETIVVPIKTISPINIENKENSKNNINNSELSENNKINTKKLDKEVIIVSKFESNNKLKSIVAKDKNILEELKEGELYTDANFNCFSKPPNDDMEESKDDINTEIRWLRPHELVPNPILGLDNIKPDECMQGTLGDCWLIAAFGALAKFPQIFKQIFPSDQSLYGFNYKGFVKVCFWQYGEWIEVIVDDKLPTRRNNLIYGHCKTVSNFWLPLLEKAYAKLLGSYENLIGGNTERALIDLSGAFFVPFSPNIIELLPVRYKIEDEAVENKRLIGCASIRFKSTTTETSYHAFSILAINKVTTNEGVLERIYTLRNPHGISKESTRISSKDKIWGKIDEEAKRNILYDGNEVLSWMRANTIMEYFEYVTIAYHVPMLDKERKYFEFIGNWQGPFDDTYSIEKYLNYPHYLLKVSDKNLQKNGKADIITNLIQEVSNSEKKEYFGIKIMSLSVRKPVRAKINEALLGSIRYEISSKTPFLKSRQESNFFSLFPGYYILLPSVSNLDNRNLKFLFRVFSYADISVEELRVEQSEKFYTNNGKYIKIIALRCAACDELIQGGYTYDKDKLAYHNECYKSSNTCDSCAKYIEGSYYNMENGFRFCNACYEMHKNRIYSARDKFSKKI